MFNITTWIWVTKKIAVYQMLGNMTMILHLMMVQLMIDTVPVMIEEALASMMTEEAQTTTMTEEVLLQMKIGVAEDQHDFGMIETTEVTEGDQLRGTYRILEIDHHCMEDG